MFHPLLHRSPVVFKQAGITKLQVGRPRNNDAGISPSGDAITGGANARRHVGERARRTLRVTNVGRELTGKSGQVRVERSRSPEDFRIANLAAFSRKFATDIRDAQSPTGAFTDVSPRVGPTGDSVAGWADAGVIIPWSAYLQFRDTRVLEDNWVAMEKSMEHIANPNPKRL